MKYLDLEFIIKSIVELESNPHPFKSIRKIECGIDNDWKYTSAVFYENGEFQKGAFMYTGKDGSNPVCKIGFDDGSYELISKTTDEPEFLMGVYNGDSLEGVHKYYNIQKKSISSA